MCKMIRGYISLIGSLFFCCHCFEKAYGPLLMLLYIFLLLKCHHEDIYLNPGSKKIAKNSLSICHWNLNSWNVHNFSKLTQLKVHNSTKDIWWKRSFCPWNQSRFLINSDKSLLSPEQRKLKEVWDTTL